MKEVIDKILIQYHSELQAEIDKANVLLGIKRIYDAGQSLEIALKNLLHRLLPLYVGITRGVIFDSEVNKISEEIDLIFYDKRYFNGFEVISETNTKVSAISIDTVLGIVSVKKKLNLKTLKESIKNIESVYKLKRNSLKNQLHYDTELANKFSYKKGLELNKIFSCLIAYENDLQYQTKNKKIVKKSFKEQEEYFIKLHEQGKLSSYKFDLIFTVDGSLMQTLNYNKEKNNVELNFDSQSFGEVKQAWEDGKPLEWYEDKLFIGYSFNEKDSYKILGQFISYLQLYVKQLVKNTPDVQEIFSNMHKGNNIGYIKK